MKKKYVFLHDNLQPQYLDGAKMRYQVEDGPYPSGETLGYFDKLEDAQLFAKAYASKVVMSDDDNYSEVKAKYQQKVNK